MVPNSKIMLKGKIKHPDQLGSFVAGFEDDRAEEEELETFRPNIGFDTDRESKKDAAGGSSVSLAPRLKSEKDSVGPVSVLKAIAADEKRSNLEFELSRPEINLEKLQRISSSGLPNVGGLRATTWKLLLGYLPTLRELWEKELEENRLKYAKLKEELLSTPSKLTRRNDIDRSSNTEPEEINIDCAGPLPRHEISEEDHPLSLGKSSAWNQYFQHNEITEQIDRDLERTHPDIKFFSGDSPSSKKNRQAMKNILLLFSKLNPAIRYVQGMNEVLAPIFYLFSTDTNEQNAANAEADSFACFVRLLSDSVDHFCQKLDNSAVGIFATLSRLNDMLKSNDFELWRHLEFASKVKPQYYAFRWITLLLTQEFSFQTIMRIWDTLLSNPFGVQDMLLRVCCAMLLCQKARLIRGDFVANLRLLQNYPDIDIEHLLRVAQDISPDTSSYRLSP